VPTSIQQKRVYSARGVVCIFKAPVVQIPRTRIGTVGFPPPPDARLLRENKFEHVAPLRSIVTHEVSGYGSNLNSKPNCILSFNSYPRWTGNEKRTEN
jgi:hypothetical protein